MVLDAELVAQVGGQAVVAGQLHRHFTRERRLQPAAFVDLGELRELGFRMVAQRIRLAPGIGRFRIGLRAHRHVLARGHRERTRSQAGDAAEQDRAGRRLRGGHAQHQAAGGDQAVVGAQHRGAQPAGALAAMRFDVFVQCVHQSSTRQKTAFK